MTKYITDLTETGISISQMDYKWHLIVLISAKSIKSIPSMIGKDLWLKWARGGGVEEELFYTLKKFKQFL